MRIFLKVALIVMTSLHLKFVTAQKNKDLPDETVTKSVVTADTVVYHMTTYTYKKIDTVQLQLDVYSPETADAQPSPSIMLFHGGGWATGKRSQLSWQCRSTGYRHRQTHPRRQFCRRTSGHDGTLE